MLSDLKDMVVESEFVEVNSDYVAYQMVRPEWVIEISCLDLISQTTRGGNVNRMVIDFEATCDEHNFNYNHEIIEFPVVLVDASERTVVSKRFFRLICRAFISFVYCYHLNLTWNIFYEQSSKFDFSAGTPEISISIGLCLYLFHDLCMIL